MVQHPVIALNDRAVLGIFTQGLIQLHSRQSGDPAQGVQAVRGGLQGFGLDGSGGKGRCTGGCGLKYIVRQIQRVVRQQLCDLRLREFLHAGAAALSVFSGIHTRVTGFAFGIVRSHKVYDLSAAHRSICGVHGKGFLAYLVAGISMYDGEQDPAAGLFDTVNDRSMAQGSGGLRGSRPGKQRQIACLWRIAAPGIYRLIPVVIGRCKGLDICALTVGQNTGGHRRSGYRSAFSCPPAPQWRGG